MDMEFVVIDTDVISYIFKGDTRGEMYRPHLDNRLGVLSFMTVAENSICGRRCAIGG
jgi:hypothetical protein